MTRVYAVVAALVVAVALAATYWFTFASRDGDEFAACRGSSIAMGTASIGGPFTLVNGAGETVTDADVITKPSLIYFGYTFCPDVCPLDNARNAEALDILIEQNRDVQGVFISVDPERDTPAMTQEFAGYMHETMVGLTGSPEQVAAASRAYKTYYKKQEPEEGEEEFYLVDHSTFTYLVLPKVGFVEFFKRDDTPEEIAQRTACFIEHAPGS
jgi:protein SCO1/2